MLNIDSTKLHIYIESFATNISQSFAIIFSYPVIEKINIKNCDFMYC